jgi:LuxR family maltose regulon positive regulatory protein
MRNEMRLVRRQRVIDLMHRSTTAALTLVQAPLGYGKTVAVAQFAEASGHRVIPLDVRHLTAQGVPKLEDVPWDDRTTLVVFEDLQTVRYPEVLDRLAMLVEYVPAHVRILATSRRPLDLPVARWRAQGLLSEIGPEELCFRPDEVAAAFPHDPLSPADRAALHQLHERSEGWPAGLRLLAATSPTGSVATYAGRALLDQVLADQPDDIRQFLTETSVLLRFTADLARHVTGSPEAGRLLDRVGHAELFLQPLDEERVWFRYQRLFGELLRARLHAGGDGDERARELHERAAHWFLERRQPDAIGHLVAAGGGEQALDLLAADVEFVGQDERSRRPVDWNAVFPPNWVAGSPTRMVYAASVLTRTGSSKQAAEWLDRAERALAGAPLDHPARALLATTRAIWHAFEGNPAQTLAIGRRALELFGDRVVPSRRRLVGNMAICHLLLDQLDEAEACCKELDDSHSSDVVRGLVIPAVRARIAERRGALNEAEHLARRALGTAEALDLHFHTASQEARVALTRVLTERGQFDEAHDLLASAIESYRLRGWMGGVVEAEAELTGVVAGRDGPEAALAALAALTTLEGTGSRPEDLPPAVQPVAERLEARLRIEVGDLERAEWLIGRLPDDVDRDLLLVSLAIARGHLGEAADRLDRVRVPHLRSRIVADLRAARIAALRGQVDQRDRRLLDAASAGVAEGFCLVYLTEVPELLPALRALAQTRRQLLPLVLDLDALQARSAVATPGQELSKRELSVLRYLTSELTNPEIASQLDITTNTLKTHVRSLYRKLGVGSRADAVRAARESGLL